MRHFISPQVRASLPPENGEENHLASSQKRKHIFAVCSTIVFILALVGGSLAITAAHFGFFGDDGRAHADTSTDLPAASDQQLQAVDEFLQSITDSEKSLSEMSESELADAVAKAQSKTNAASSTNKDSTSATVAFTKTIDRTESIAFIEENTTTADLPRGQSVVAREGIVGEKTVTYLVSFSQDGVILDFKKQSETITRSPVNQLIATGTSDYNLNAGIAVTNYSSYTCLAIDAGGTYDCADDIKLTSAYQIATGPIYLQYFTDTSGQARSFTTPITVSSGSTFSYGDQLHLFGTIRSSSVPLDATFCNNHGLACGSW